MHYRFIRLSVKYSIFPLITLLSLVGFIPFTAHAQSHKVPDIQCANFQCSSNLHWNNAIHGAKTVMTVSNPGLATGEGWARYIQGEPVIGGDEVFVGEDKGINCASNIVHYFYLILTPTGKISQCYGACSGDINNSGQFGYSYFVSNGGGTMIWIDSLSSCGNICNPCYIGTGSAGETFDAIDIHEEINATWTGHKVWGSFEGANQWQSTRDGSWHFQTNGGSVSAHNPPQMFWHIPPSTQNPGGVLYSCDYDMGSNNCVLGG